MSKIMRLAEKTKLKRTTLSSQTFVTLSKSLQNYSFKEAIVLSFGCKYRHHSLLCEVVSARGSTWKSRYAYLFGVRHAELENLSSSMFENFCTCRYYQLSRLGPFHSFCLSPDVVFSKYLLPFSQSKFTMSCSSVVSGPNELKLSHCIPYCPFSSLVSGELLKISPYVSVFCYMFCSTH